MYTFESKIRYSEIDKNGKLSMEALLNYFQDCSTFHSEYIGLGISYLLENKKVWVMTAWQIVVDRYPGLCEDIIVGTAPYEFRGFMGYRNFLLQTRAGEQLACANSVWTLLDTETGRPVKAGREMLEGYVLEEKLPMDYAPRKIEVMGEGRSLDPICVKPHHLDTNNHVNNGQYIRMAIDCMDVCEPDNENKIHQLRAEYRKSAVLGDIIYPVIMHHPNSDFIISLQNEEGQPFCVVELKRNKEQ